MTADYGHNALRAYLDWDKWDADLTDEQREIANKRRQILGSLDETYALNRAERNPS